MRLRRKATLTVEVAVDIEEAVSRTRVVLRWKTPLGDVLGRIELYLIV